MDRREFLAAIGAGAVASTLLPSNLFASELEADELITRMRSPYCGEPPAELLAENWVTPASRFYVLNHGSQPTIDAADYRLEIGGDVRSPLSFSLDQLRSEFRFVEVDATLMCAGNRRYEMHQEQAVKAVPLWRSQAIGNARWGGVLLSDVLAKARLKRKQGHVHLSGSDRFTFDDKVTGFAGSIPLRRVAQRNPGPVLLAYEMNGKPLPAAHGYPLRALVPGMIGARSVKWLREIQVTDTESDNMLFERAHRLPGDGDTRPPIYEFPVTSAILSQSEVIAGMTVLRGYALVGGNDTVATVSVSIDGGKGWRKATLLEPKVRGCWRFWEIKVPFVPGNEVLARATTRKGASMPATVAWNRNGYLYNGWASWQLRPS